MPHDGQTIPAGAACYTEGDPQRAVALIEEVLAAYPAYDDGREVLIHILDEQQDAKTLIRVCAEGIRHSPEISDYHYFLGKALIAVGETDAARRAFERYRRLNPPQAQVRAMEVMLEALDD